MAVFRPVLFAPIDVTGTGDHVILPGIANTRIRLLNYLLVYAADVNAMWKSGANELSGALDLPGQGGVQFTGTNESPAFETNRGEDLILNLDAAVHVGGHLAWTPIS